MIDSTPVEIHFNNKQKERTKDKTEIQRETDTMTEHLSIQARSTYRALLRELPRRHLSSPSPLQHRLRKIFRGGADTSPSSPSPSISSKSSPSPSSSSSTIKNTKEDLNLRLQEASQYAQYARAQRSYAALLERYNPGMGMNEGERIRLTARRVGLDLPEMKGEKAGVEGTESGTE